MRNDRIDLMVLVQDCLAAKHDVPWALLVDTLIAKGYHRCDKDERKKMDAEDRALDIDSAMSMRVNAMNDVVYDLMRKSTEFPVGSGERGAWQRQASKLTEVITTYNELRAETQRKNGLV